MIYPTQLTQSDIGRKVVYTAFEGATPQEGRITS